MKFQTPCVLSVPFINVCSYRTIDIIKCGWGGWHIKAPQLIFTLCPCCARDRNKGMERPECLPTRGSWTAGTDAHVIRRMVI